MQLIPSNEDAMRRPPYLTVSGAALNCNTQEGFFDCNAPQYTSFYRDRRHLSMLPIRAYFDDVRYKNRKPVPSNNTYICVEGFVTHVDIDLDNGQVSLFHMSTDNINFLGKAVLPSGPSSNQGTYDIFSNLKSNNSFTASSSTPCSNRFRYNFSSPSNQQAPGSATPSSPTPGHTDSTSKRQSKRNRT